MQSPNRLLTALAAVAVVALFAAGWFGWTWWSAAHADTTTRAQDRDTVLSAAADALVALNTVDYRNAGPAVDKWIQVTTGELGKTLSGDRQVQLDRTTASKTVASASVNQAAVAELDETAGTARVIAVLDVRLSTNGAASAPSRSRLNAALDRTPQGWKVSSVQAAG
jgi:Mce-associated membrane protein